jgi:hypothetical protein
MTQPTLNNTITLNSEKMGPKLNSHPKNISRLLGNKPQKVKLKTDPTPLPNKNVFGQEINQNEKDRNSLKNLFSSKIGILKIKKFGQKEMKIKSHKKLKKHKHHRTRRKMLSANGMPYKKLMRRRRMIAKRRKNIEKLSNMKEAIKRKQMEQKANLISDRTFLNLINEQVIADDLFDHGNIKGNNKQKTKGNRRGAKVPVNSLESEVVYNKKSSKLEDEIKDLEEKIQELKFHQLNTNEDLKDLVDSESKGFFLWMFMLICLDFCGCWVNFFR